MNFAIAVFAATTIVLVSPFMGQLQSFLRRSLTTRQYVLLFGVGVLVAVGAAILLAFVRIRERRGRRFALLAAAGVFGGSYMWAMGTPWPEVNAVERVHFVEYGLIAFLFYRVWRPAGDLSMLILPMLLAFMTGTLDEWLQWFIPVRVGEAHDVFLNLVSITCGLMFAFALLPPPSFSLTLRPHTQRQAGFIAALVWLVFAGFLSQVHQGHSLTADGIGTFLSHYTEDELNTLQAQRAVEWQTSPPRTLRRLSQEDQYLDEGLWHVRRRNLTDGDEAWRENLILERYFVPVLDIPTYASPDGNRWLPEQRRNIEVTLKSGAPPFVSAANPYPIYVWPRAWFWLIVMVGAVLCLATPKVMSYRRNSLARSSY